MSDLKLAEIAERINAHLKRMEADKAWNRFTYTDREGEQQQLSHLYYAGAYRAGSRVGVSYISYQHRSMLTRAEALAYLEWLDAGNRGRHYEQQAEARN